MKKNIVITSAIVIAISFAVYSADEPVQDEETTKQEPKKEVVLVATQQEAINLVNALIKGNSSFSIKLSDSLLPGKVRSWQQRGLIKYPTKQIPWVTFKKDVNELNTFLHSLLNKNPQTGTYYHMENLQKNRALYNALQKIERALATYEPKIIATTAPFKLDKESLSAMQKLINVYGVTFYQGKLLGLIKKFFTSFEGEAKKIRTQEETAAQRAGRGKAGRFEMPEISSDYGLDLGSEFDFTSPVYEPETPVDLDLFSSDSDDFISSFFIE